MSSAQLSRERQILANSFHFGGSQWVGRVDNVRRGHFHRDDAHSLTKWNLLCRLLVLKFVVLILRRVSELLCSSVKHRNSPKIGNNVKFIAKAYDILILGKVEKLEIILKNRFKIFITL